MGLCSLKARSNTEGCLEVVNSCERSLCAGPGQAAARAGFAGRGCPGAVPQLPERGGKSWHPGCGVGCRVGVPVAPPSAPRLSARGCLMLLVVFGVGFSSACSISTVCSCQECSRAEHGRAPEQCPGAAQRLGAAAGCWGCILLKSQIKLLQRRRIAPLWACSSAAKLV